MSVPIVIQIKITRQLQLPDVVAEAANSMPLGILDRVTTMLVCSGHHIEVQFNIIDTMPEVFVGFKLACGS